MAYTDHVAYKLSLNNGISKAMSIIMIVAQESRGCVVESKLLRILNTSGLGQSSINTALRYFQPFMARGFPKVISNSEIPLAYTYYRGKKDPLEFFAYLHEPKPSAEVELSEVTQQLAEAEARSEKWYHDWEDAVERVNFLEEKNVDLSNRLTRAKSEVKSLYGRIEKTFTEIILNMLDDDAIKASK